MVSVFSFRSGPEFRAAQRAELFDSALNQPMSAGATFWDQAKGGALESFGLGTGIRGLAIPQGNTSELSTAERIGRTVESALTGGLPGLVVQGARQIFSEPEPPLTEDAYKASEFYRENVPWDAAMTRARAAALASWDDARRVRQYYAEKRPITSFFGNLAGQALDPINYIPVAGPAVKAAATAQAGRVAGTAAAASLDAAANTAVFGLATASQRGRYGDDVSWQAIISEVAVAALIGGAFGTAAGVLGRRADTKALKDAEARLSTLKTTQEARVALNEAIDAVVRGEPVALSPNAIEPVQKIVAAEAPRLTIDKMAREADPEAFDRLNALDTTFYLNETELKRLQSQVTDNERYGPTRAAMIEVEQLAKKLERFEANTSKAAGTKQEARLALQRDEVRAQLRNAVARIDDRLVQEIEDADVSLASRRDAQAKVAAERAAVQERVRIVTDEARRRYWANLPAPEQPAMGQAAAPVVLRQPAVDAVRAAPEPVPVGRAEAEARITKAEDLKAISAQYGVDPQTGDFVEQAELKQLEAEGRLTDEDQAEMAAADETLQNADAYGRALDAAVACLI